MKENMFDMSSIRNLKQEARKKKRYLLGSSIVNGDTFFSQ